MDLGKAYVQIMPSAQGISGSIQKAINPEATAAGRSAGTNIAQSMASSLNKAGKTLTKAITVPVLGATTAIGGMVAALGWKRLVAVDTAQAQLKGLGYTAEDVARISDGLRDAISGGMLTMAEATSAAATAMAAGVKEGDELTRYIQLLDSAVVGGTGTFTEMEQIFGRIVDQGKMTRTEFDMIAQRMPGFSSAVQESMGVSSEAMYEMLRNGEITTDDFLDVMEDFAGGMADAYADSWWGMVQNTLANIGIIGETILGGVFEQSKESIAEFLDFLRSDDLKEWAQQTGETIGESFSNMIENVKSAIEWWNNLSEGMKSIVDRVGAIAVAIGPVMLALSKIIGIVTKLAPLFKALGAAIAALTSPIGLIVAAIVGAAALVYIYWEPIKDFFINLWESISETAIAMWEGLMEFLEPILTAIAGFVMDMWDKIMDFWDEYGSMIMEASENVWNAIMTIVGFVIDIIVKNVQMMANTIMMVWDFLWPIVQAVVENVWNTIKVVIETVIDVVLGIIKMFAALFTGDWQGVWDAAKGIAQSVWTGIVNLIRTQITGALNIVKSILSSILNTFKNIFNKVKSAVTDGMNNVKNGIRDGISSALDTVLGFVSKFFDAGKNIVTSIADGIKSAAKVVTDAVGNLAGKVRDFLPFSPPKTGPLTDIMDVKWGETIAGGIVKGESVVADAMDSMLGFDLAKKSKFYSYNSRNNSLLEATLEQNKLLSRLLDKDQNLYVNDREMGKVLTPAIKKQMEKNERIMNKVRY